MFLQSLSSAVALAPCPESMTIGLGDGRQRR